VFVAIAAFSLSVGKNRMPILFFVFWDRIKWKLDLVVLQVEVDRA